MSGRRVFDDRLFASLMVVRPAGDAGFTLAEIRQLVTEFGRNRWRRLAQRKLAEVRAASERLRALAELLEKLVRCECLDIEFCGRAIEKSAAGRKVTGRRFSPATSGAALCRAGSVTVRPPLTAG